MRWILFLLPWFELFSLIQLGSRVGALAALAYVFLTAVLGLSILRIQGLEVVGKLRQAQAAGSVAPQLMLADMAVGLAGLLLLTPGLLTDAVAVLLLIGPLWRRIGSAFRPDAGPARESGGAGDLLEGEFRRLDDD
jgi:UPF0716 protein FxsA